MAKVYAELDERLRKFIVVQPIFLVGTGRSRSWTRAGRDALARSDHPAPVRDPDS